MKTKIVCSGLRLAGVLWAALFASPLMAVDCTPDSITLSSQAEVNNFQANHGPGCDTIVVELTVSGADITDLSPLSGVTTANINSRIRITNNPALPNLDGLGLTDVFWLEVSDNGLLANIDALTSLTTTGPVFIERNATLPNVDGLSSLTSLGSGALILTDNPSLSDLSGVSGLTSIGASLVIRNNDLLTHLDDFSALTSVAASMSITDNDGLTSISGLSGIVGFTSALSIRNNASLPDLQGLFAVSTLNGLIIDDNPSLVNIDGLSGLTAVGNAFADLLIDNNAVLTNLDGLASLIAVNADLRITNNPSLASCSSLAALLDQTDDASPGPGPGAAGIPDVDGDVVLSGNLPGCNAVEDIVDEGPSAPLPQPQEPTPIPALNGMFLALLIALIALLGLGGVHRRIR
jgi:hypothetical protein